MNAQAIKESIKEKDLIELFRQIHLGYEEVDKMRTFAKFFREYLDESFSSRGIPEKYGVGYYQFLKSIYQPEEDYYLLKMYPVDHVVNFVAFASYELTLHNSGFAETMEGIIGGLQEAEEAVEVSGSVETGIEVHKKSENGQSVPSDDELLKTWTTESRAAEFIGDVVPEEDEWFEDDETSEEPEETPFPVKVERSKYESKQIRSNLALNIPIDEIVDSAVQGYIEGENGLRDYVEQTIKQEVAKLKPNHVHIGDAEPVVIKDKLHKAFRMALTLLKTEKQIYLCGPAGSGKTTLASQMAEVLQVPFGHISCTAGMSEAHLLGRMVANGTYISSQLVDLYENGGVFLFDEVDAADPNTLLVINSALSNGSMSVPNRKGNNTAKRHDNFYAVCAANTWGRGSSEYAGRNIMDAAFMDRFAGGKVDVKYDTSLETEIMIDYPEETKALFGIRENIDKYNMRRVLSTRVFVSCYRLMKSGLKFDEFLKVYFTGWTEEERKKAQTGA